MVAWLFDHVILIGKKINEYQQGVWVKNLSKSLAIGRVVASKFD